MEISEIWTGGLPKQVQRKSKKYRCKRNRDGIDRILNATLVRRGNLLPCEEPGQEERSDKEISTRQMPELFNSSVNFSFVQRKEPDENKIVWTRKKQLK